MSQEKLIKSLEALRSLIGVPESGPSKISHCCIVSEALANPTVKSSSNFVINLTSSTEIFLILCDDDSSDVRMKAEECLNRVLRSLSIDGAISKVIDELLKCMKTNEATRSVKAALWRFAHYAHTIRPPIWKSYLSTVIPTILLLISKCDEQISQVLADNFNYIFKELQPFMTDNEMKDLLMAFLINSQNESTLIRRTSTNCILHICKNVKRPYMCAEYVINYLLNTIIPLNEKRADHIILGVLTNMRNLIPYLRHNASKRHDQNLKLDNSTSGITVDKILQIYEICIYYLSYNEHNVHIASLDVLSNLFKHCSNEIFKILLDDNGLKAGRIFFKTQTHIGLPSYKKADNSKSDLASTTSENSDDVVRSPEDIELNNKHNLSTDMSKGKEKVVHLGQVSSGNQIEFCTRLICKTFLLSNEEAGYISDKDVRVAVKASSLVCLCEIFNRHPIAFLLPFDGENSSITRQISNILIFCKHEDPYLRGLIRVVFARFLYNIIAFYGNNYGEWLIQGKDRNGLQMDAESICNIFIQGLKDDSATCVKETVESLNTILHLMLKCTIFYKQTISIILVLLSLVKHPYWLVKVTTMDLLSQLSYTDVYYIQQNLTIQNEVVDNVFLELLKNDDVRLRNAAAKSLSRIVSNLYNDNYGSFEDEVQYKTIEYHIKDMPILQLTNFRFDQNEYILSIIIEQLFHEILMPSSKYVMFGYVKALSILSDDFPCHTYRKAWNCCKSDCDTLDFLNIVVHLLKMSNYVYEIECHTDLLKLTANLYKGYFHGFITTIENYTEPWCIYRNAELKYLSDEYLSHILQMLNIFYDILHDPFVPQTQLKNLLPLFPITSTTSMAKHKIDSDKSLEKGDRIKPHFHHSSHYLKISRTLNASFENYQNSLDVNISAVFTNILKQTLFSLYTIIEAGTVNEFGSIAEEILCYLHTLMNIEPEFTIECVNRLLQCLFAINLEVAYNSLAVAKNQDQRNNLRIDETDDFYQKLIEHLYDFKNVTTLPIDVSPCNLEDTYKSLAEKFSHTNETSDIILAKYIRIFEGIVIKSLKTYTLTNNALVQNTVLRLLVQLINLKVNYCLLDANQVFLSFVLKQFDFIEEGQIAQVEYLLPAIFKLLVQLSYSKQHSKTIIQIPIIIQLCDGLMASGQSAVTHCIPALKPIVEDIFLCRNENNTIDIKELETTREVLLAMLLRLLDYHAVMNLISTVLEFSKNTPHKWLNYSRQVFSLLLSHIKHNKLQFRCRNEYFSIYNLIQNLNCSTLFTVDEILLILFQFSALEDCSDELFSKNLASILVLIQLLLLKSEEHILNGLKMFKGKISFTTTFEMFFVTLDPLNVVPSSNVDDCTSPELIIGTYLYRIIFLTSERCVSTMCYADSNYYFLPEKLDILMGYCTQFCDGKNYKNIHCSVQSNLQHFLIDKVTSNIKKMVLWCPMLVLKWCHLMILLKYKEAVFWREILFESEKLSDVSINCNIIKRATCFMYCKLHNEVLEPICDVNLFITKNILSIITLCNEKEIKTFISSTHSNMETFHMLVNTVIDEFLLSNSIPFLLYCIQCIDDCYTLEPRILFKILKVLGHKEIMISKSFINKIEEQLKILLSSFDKNVEPHEFIELEAIENTISQIEKNKRYTTTLYLLKKLQDQHFKNEFIPEIEFTLTTESINENWYLNLVKSKSIFVPELLHILNEEEIVDILASKQITQTELEKCTVLGIDQLCRNNNSPLLLGTLNHLFQQLNEVIDVIPEPHEIFDNFRRAHISSKIAYYDAVGPIFHKDEVYFKISQILSSFTVCLQHLVNTSKYFADVKFKLVKLATFSLELVNYLISKNSSRLNVNIIDSVLIYFRAILIADNDLNLYEGLKNTWLYSALSSFFVVVNFLFDNKPEIVNDQVENDEIVAVHQLHSLISWLFNCKLLPSKSSLFYIAEDIVKLICKVSVFNSYITPEKMICAIVPTNTYHSTDNNEKSALPHPQDFSCNSQELKQYLFRLSLTGWPNKYQFEENWMCLLNIMSNLTTTHEATEDLNDIINDSSLAIVTVTELLIESLKTDPGHSTTYLHVSRNPPISTQNENLTKLRSINDTLLAKCGTNVSLYPQMKSVFNAENLEKINSNYSSNQVSIQYLLISSNMLTDDECEAFKIWKRRQNVIGNLGIDINSCLQFLLDFYTDLMKSNLWNSCTKLLYYTVKSLNVISDLFTDKSHFEQMSNMLLTIIKTHPLEDDVMYQYLIIGVCKVVAVLNPNLDTYEQARKLIAHGFKSSFPPLVISALQGALYLLEGCKLSNVTIGGLSDEINIILPTIIDYVALHLNATKENLFCNDEHTLLIWSISFYIIENMSDFLVTYPNFESNTLQAVFLLLKTDNITTITQINIIKNLERLYLLKSSIQTVYNKQIFALALNIAKNSDQNLSMLGFQLIVSSMYNKSDYNSKVEVSKESNDDTHLVPLEEISTIFEQISVCDRFQANVLCAILPNLIHDFFAPPEILAKLLTEFTSPPHFNTTAISSVVYKVFEFIISEDKLILLQQWIVHILPNIDELYPNDKLLWYLVNLLVSASTNKYLRAVFPYTQTINWNRYSVEDKSILFASLIDFYTNLKSVEHKKIFMSICRTINLNHLNVGKLCDELESTL